MTAGQLRGLLRGLPANKRIQFTVLVPFSASEVYDEKGRPRDLALIMDGGIELDPDPASAFSIRITGMPTVMYPEAEE